MKYSILKRYVSTTYFQIVKGQNFSNNFFLKNWIQEKLLVRSSQLYHPEEILWNHRGIKLEEFPITNFNYTILTQWRASRSLKFLILSFCLLLKITYLVQKLKNETTVSQIFISIFLSMGLNCKYPLRSDQHQKLSLGHAE